MSDVQAAQPRTGQRRAEMLPGAKWTQPNYEPLGGKIPYPGARIWYWYVVSDYEPGKGTMRPLVGHLDNEDSRGIEADAKRGVWKITFFNRSMIRQKTQVPFSATPRAGFWSWPVDPNQPKQEAAK